MFDILRKSLSTGVVTTRYPETPAAVSGNARGRPAIDFAHWKDARPAAAICPTGAIAVQDKDWHRSATLDLGLCVFCGLCAEVDPAIRMTPECELAARRRDGLKTTVRYRLKVDGTQEKLVSGPGPEHPAPKIPLNREPPDQPLEALGRQLQDRIQRVLGRSLHIREVDAGSCNGCEIEIVGLNSPV